MYVETISKHSLLTAACTLVCTCSGKTLIHTGTLLLHLLLLSVNQEVSTKNNRNPKVA